MFFMFKTTQSAVTEVILYNKEANFRHLYYSYQIDRDQHYEEDLFAPFLSLNHYL